MLSVGCDIESGNQANGAIRAAQLSFRLPTSDERDAYINHPYEQRMSRSARFFAQLTQAGNELAYKRAPVDPDYTIDAEASGSSDIDAMTLYIAIFQEDDPLSTAVFHDKFYIDNTRLWVTTTLWEFSPDEGTTWYALFDFTDEPWTRIAFDVLTDRVRVRATSTNETDWIQGYFLQPISWYERDSDL
jgi:hypothetical protein